MQPRPKPPEATGADFVQVGTPHSRGEAESIALAIIDEIQFETGWRLTITRAPKSSHGLVSAEFSDNGGHPLMKATFGFFEGGDAKGEMAISLSENSRAVAEVELYSIIKADDGTMWAILPASWDSDMIKRQFFAC